MVSKLVSKGPEEAQSISLGLTFFPQTSNFRSGGGGIRTLDTPLRGITDGSFAAVYGHLIFPISKPGTRTRRRSLFIIVRDGLVYWLVYIRDCRQYLNATRMLGRPRTCGLLIRSHYRSGTWADMEGQAETKQLIYARFALPNGQEGTQRDTRLRSDCGQTA